MHSRISIRGPLVLWSVRSSVRQSVGKAFVKMRRLRAVLFRKVLKRTIRVHPVLLTVHPPALLYFPILGQSHDHMITGASFSFFPLERFQFGSAWIFNCSLISRNRWCASGQSQTGGLDLVRVLTGGQWMNSIFYDFSSCMSSSFPAIVFWSALPCFFLHLRNHPHHHPSSSLFFALPL